MMRAEAIAVLIDQLDSSELPLRLEAKQALIEMGSAAVDPLAACVRRYDGRHAWMCLNALSEIDDPRVVDVLTEVLQAPAPFMRQTAASRLGAIPGPRSEQALIQALQDEETVVRIWVVDALGKLGSLAAVPYLIDVLADAQSATLRHTVVAALGNIGDPRAIEPIAALRHDANHHVREHVTEALAKLRQVLHEDVE